MRDLAVRQSTDGFEKLKSIAKRIVDVDAHVAIEWVGCDVGAGCFERGDKSCEIVDQQRRVRLSSRPEVTLDAKVIP